MKNVLEGFITNSRFLNIDRTQSGLLEHWDAWFGTETIEKHENGGFQCKIRTIKDTF